MLIAIAVLLLFYLISGLRLCVVESGSMEPNIPTGSLCIVNTRAAYDDLELGDVVVYVRQSDGKRIIHRVVEITEEGIVTKGDANRSTDGLSVTAENLYAKNLFHIPYLGRISMAVRKPGGIAIIVLLALALIGVEVFGGRKEREEEEPKE